MESKIPKELSALDPQSRARFLAKYIKSEDIASLTGIDVPLTNEQALSYIAKMRDNPLYLKKVLGKKPKTFVNPAGVRKQVYDPLSKRDVIDVVVLGDSPLAPTYYNRVQITRLLNLCVEYARTGSSRSSTAATENRRRKLAKENFKLEGKGEQKEVIGTPLPKLFLKPSTTNTNTDHLF
uniref:Uncharacterized protein n=1 Tax=Nephroselmis olivacea TaxID=31312 RepID=Q9T3Y4_NEPOL|nr:hypothetical protein NeolCp094 [Nephroselmis olivacea]NP_050948.1 hypothetical protein NeolCp143 [Nephroselmis olivacea]AAD54870.1 unknown [Nephroselmis olivacea]AAD54919.1 unknown [Nephroselmis olivacea]